MFPTSSLTAQTNQPPNVENVLGKHLLSYPNQACSPYPWSDKVHLGNGKMGKQSRVAAALYFSNICES